MELEEFLVWHVRIPRLLLAVIVGAVLAISGTATQGLCHNPLAEPTLIGVTSGALTRLLNDVSIEGKDLPRFVNLYEWRNELTYRLPKTGASLRVDHRYVGRRDRYQLAEDGTVGREVIGGYHLLHLTMSNSFLEGRIQAIHRSEKPIEPG